jgi:hypothetical protein
MNISQKFTCEPTDLIPIVTKTIPRDWASQLGGREGSTLRLRYHGRQEIWTVTGLMQ